MTNYNYLSPYYGRPVYKILGQYDPVEHKLSQYAIKYDLFLILNRLPKSASLHEEVLLNRFFMVVYLVHVAHVSVNERKPDTLATPLHHACQHAYISFIFKNRSFGGRYTDIMRFLIANGANVNLKDAEGFAPIHWAANEGTALATYTRY